MRQVMNDGLQKQGRWSRYSGMRFTIQLASVLGILVSPLAASPAGFDEVAALVEAADRTGREIRRLIDNDQVATFWAEDDSRLAFRVSGGAGGTRFSILDPSSGEIQPAFDHARLATELGEKTGRALQADDLPVDDLSPAPAGGSGISFTADGRRWTWHPEDGLAPSTERLHEIPIEHPQAHQRSGNQGKSTRISIENATEGDIEIFWLNTSGAASSYDRIPAGGKRMQNTYAGHSWRVDDAESGRPLASFAATDIPATVRITGRIARPPRTIPGRSPDGRWTVRVDQHNLMLHPAGEGAPVALTTDGTAAHPYSGPLHWAPDSRAVVAWRARRVDVRQIHFIEAAPADQLQPRLHSLNYAKPGDEIRQPMPQLFAIGDGGEPRQLPLDESLFENPWANNRPWWSPDGASFDFLHNRRGHQLMRLIRLCARTGNARVVIEETSPTFIDYSQKTWLHHLDDGREILWMSERDGHNHILLVDAATATVKTRVTSGPWNVRSVVDVDDAARELLIETIGMDAANPYHSHFARVAIDGGADGRPAVTRLTSSPGHHTIARSPGGKWITATWSRPDHPPVVEVRNAKTGVPIAEISRADDARARSRGWLPPERFSAKGRDGATDIHGLIYRPVGFDPAKRYPVVETIYAGPHNFFVPQGFSAWNGKMRMAQHGFIVVKIDGMGTNWRNKAFHDHAWKNLRDSGFPDRIAWIKAAAESRPWMDLSRVGIFGGSAGGQSTAAALLHHGDFYHTGVADCGCHDNRIDKIWWNEAWMGWPIDESYAANSNATHAANLRGNLMLIVGEIDRNVDPASTDQLAAALQQAGKRFEFVRIFNAGHGAAETAYGNLVRTDFLIRHLGGPQAAD